MRKNIISTMLFEYDQFTKSEKKIADYVLEHLNEAQHSSITDLSAACGVSVSTVSNFCRRLKLSNFNEFKLELAQSYVIAGKYDFAETFQREIQAEDSVDTVKKKSLVAMQSALNNTYHMLQKQVVIRALDLIEKARHVICLGQGIHSVVAMATCALFATVTDKFSVVQDAHLQTVVLASLVPEDVVLYFSYSGATYELLSAAELIKERGAKLMLVTRFRNSPASAYADVVMLCGPKEQYSKELTTTAVIAQLFVTDVLYKGFCLRDHLSSNDNHVN